MFPGSPVSHAADRTLDIPIEIRPRVGAPLAAGRADKSRLDIREAEIVGPRIAADRDRVATLEIGALDQQAAHAAAAHQGKCDPLRTVGHRP